MGRGAAVIMKREPKIEYARVESVMEVNDGEHGPMVCLHIYI